ncbi:MAG: hypothetical protein ACOX44_06410 [Limnochordia bacterium]|jgi:hypothetical protein
MYRHGIRSLFVRTVALLCLLCLGQGMAAAVDSVIGIYQPDGRSVQPLVDLFKSRDYPVRILDEEGLENLTGAGISALVIPPDTMYPAAARQTLNTYLSGAGNLVDLSVHGLNYTPSCLNPTQIVEFGSEQRGYYIMRGTEVPQVTYPEIPGMPGVRGIHLASRVGAGDVYLDIPMTAHRAADRSVLSFMARGDYEVEILFLRIRDSRGTDWVAFIDATPEWQQYQVSFADFVPVDAKKLAAGELLDPASILRLHIGFDPTILWTELQGSFGVGPIYLGSPAEDDIYTPTAEVTKWQVAYIGNKTQMPNWVIDPFLDTQPLDNVVSIDVGLNQAVSGRLPDLGAYKLWTVPGLPYARGREDKDHIDLLTPEDMRRIPLLIAKDGKGNTLGTLAEVRLHNDGKYRRGAWVLFGIEGARYVKGSDLGELLLDAVDYILKQPRISRVTTTIYSRNFSQLEAAILVTNPLDETVEAVLTVSAADISGSRTFNMPAKSMMEYPVVLGEIKEDFPLTDFTWQVELTSASGNDLFGDRVNVEEQLIKSAKYIIDLQNGHGDGRISHYFFSDIYGARAMLALSDYLQDPATAARNQHVLGDVTPEDIRAAALRFTDMISRRQRPDGSIPMGYNELKNNSYVADVGTITLGMAQMSSWLDEEKAAEYRNVIDKYLDWRQLYYIDEERSELLQAIYGKGHQATRVGSYGLGLMNSDYYTKVSWNETKPHEAGPTWVLTISMGTAAAMSKLDPNPKYKEIAMMDANGFLRLGESASGHFQSETTFWLIYTLTDPQVRADLMKVFERDALFAISATRKYDWFDNNSRGILRWLAPTYYRHFVKDSPLLRVSLVKALWGLCSESSTYSLEYSRHKFIHTTMGPSAGAARYATMSAAWFMELLKPGSTLLKDVAWDPVQ